MRFILIGGFLGAGKTTTIARLARVYQARGQRVGIVTNDQAADLVDTHLLRSQGLDVGEVAGACFCCHFNELTRVVDELGATARPDVILAEPVGSCTDLVATVVRPLRQLFPGRFDVAPYAVLLKPVHGRRILAGQPAGGFSPKAAYIFQKQLEEADLVVINRVDELTPAEADELAGLVQAQRPSVPIVRLSARTGEGIEALVELLAQQGQFGRQVVEVDYDIYAEGEAELGWLNLTATVNAPGEFNLDGLLVGLIARLQPRLASQGAEVAHLKTIGQGESGFGVANLVGNQARPELSIASDQKCRQAQLIVNARAAIDPALLEETVRAALDDAARSQGASVTVHESRSFRPGRPVPTHRLMKV